MCDCGCGYDEDESLVIIVGDEDGNIHGSVGDCEFDNEYSSEDSS